MNLHGGGFNADSGSYAESIPIAGYTGIKVIAVLYRLAPESPLPAAVDDAVAVYKVLLKSYKPDHVVIYGTSAGAVLTAEVAVRLKQLSLPMPAALGIFSALDSFARMGDSYAMYTLGGLAGHLDPPDETVHDPYYAGSADPKIRYSRPYMLIYAVSLRPSSFEWARRPLERHDQSASRVAPRRHRCSAGRLRCAPTRLLVSLRVP